MSRVFPVHRDSRLCGCRTWEARQAGENGFRRQVLAIRSVMVPDRVIRVARQVAHDQPRLSGGV